MSKGNTFENDHLKLVFHGIAIANIADNAASSPLASLYLSLHTADPGEGGDQTTNEATYTPYARQAVARSGSGFTITDNVVTLAATVSFPQQSSGSETITHVGIGTASSGAGKLLYKGVLSPNIVVGANVTPRITTSSTLTED